jgi:uncharacterized RmlC-like cupin family protein
VPPHIHHQESEAFYVLKGGFELIIGGNATKAGAREFVLVPRGVVHSFRNLGTTHARFLAIVTPGGLHEKYLSESGQPAESETLLPPPEGAPDLERLRQIARQYHTEMLPNPSQ